MENLADKKSPVFIIGMPRSGTKLMRALLNQHSQISLTNYESHYVPYFIKKFGLTPTFKTKEDLKPVIEEFNKTVTGITLNNSGKFLSETNFLNAADPQNWESIFRYFFKHSGSKPITDEMIWGDKTPGYINHIPLLKKLFPNARFIHMIRDPRDYALSSHKGWGKSLYRAAQRWKVSIEKAKQQVRNISSDYLEVRYEELITNTESVMRRVCTFLQIPFEQDVIQLKNPTPEDIGDVKNVAQIISTNTAKYKKSLSAKQIKRIEEIVLPVMIQLGYKPENDIAYKPLNRTSMLYYNLKDGFAIAAYRAKEQGLVKGFRYFINHYTKSSWR